MHEAIEVRWTIRWILVRIGTPLVQLILLDETRDTNNDRDTARDTDHVHFLK